MIRKSKGHNSVLKDWIFLAHIDNHASNNEYSYFSCGSSLWRTGATGMNQRKYLFKSYIHSVLNNTENLPAKTRLLFFMLFHLSFPVFRGLNIVRWMQKSCSLCPTIFPVCSPFLSSKTPLLVVFLQFLFSQIHPGSVESWMTNSFPVQPSDVPKP